MKAIVLSCDRYHPIADHMISNYQRLWPENPFIFRVPYQSFPDQLKQKHGDKIDLIKTTSGIKQTVLALISDLEDDEWVYWCIDDKYPIRLDLNALEAAHKLVTGDAAANSHGVLFCRCRKLLEDKHLDLNDSISGVDGRRYVRRRNYYQFWIHQYLRVSVLKKLFNEFPDGGFVAKDMDKFTGQDEGLSVKTFDSDQKMYVSTENYARFGESTVGGSLTKNCSESMASMGLSPSKSWDVEDFSIFLGTLESE